MFHINFCSGGIGSYISGKRIAQKYGTGNLIHLFTDTKSEDDDLYRFLRESTKKTGGQLVEITDGRNLWELFRDKKFIGNSQVDVCSKTLKRDMAKKYITENFTSSEAVLYFGIDHSERDRFYGTSEKLGICKR